MYPCGSKNPTSAPQISEAMHAYEAIVAAAAPSAADSSGWSGTSKSLTAGNYHAQVCSFFPMASMATSKWLHMLAALGAI